MFYILEIISKLWSLDFLYEVIYQEHCFFGVLNYFGLFMLIELYKFSKLVMHLNSCSMDLGRDNNPISLILVETLLGLDALFHGGETQNFLGSLLTLQIWLMERLDMIAKPTTDNYGPSSFLSKVVIKTECQTESD